MVDFDNLGDRFSVAVGMADVTDLKGADLRDMDLRGADLSKLDLTGANLQGADLTGADLRGTNLTNANLEGANLTNVKTPITSTDEFEIDGKDTVFDGANLKSATLPSLINRTFRNADLSNAKVVPHTEPRESRLPGQSEYGFRGDFEGANLSGISAHNLEIKGNFDNANFTGADLTNSHFAGEVIGERILRMRLRLQ